MVSVTTTLDWMAKATEKASKVHDYVVSPIQTAKEEINKKEEEKQYKIYPKENEYGHGVCHKITLQSIQEDGQAYIICSPDDAIPIIVIPDFMGTNLRNTATTKLYQDHGVNQTSDDKVWCMDSLDDAAETWKNQSADQRKRNLYPSDTEVCDGNNYTEEEVFHIGLDEAKERGWCKVSKFVYWEFLNWLQITMNDFASHKDGARENLFKFSFVTEDEFIKSYEYCYPVYTFPYNWMIGNSENAVELTKYITKVTQREKNKGKNVKQVLLITHGNGGQIARACVNDSESLIKGVIHIALPVNGAPEIYRRIKCGAHRNIVQKADDGIQKTVNNITLTNLSENMRDNIKDIPKDPWTYAGIAVSAWEGTKMVGSFSSKVKAVSGNVVKDSAKGAARGALISIAVQTATDIALTNQENSQYAYIDGYSEEDIAVIAATSPAYLQMLPSKNYLNFYIDKEAKEVGNKWLDVSGKLYPQANNPIDEIYLSNEFFGLYNDQSMNYGIVVSEKFYTQPDQFSAILDFDVRNFQDKISNIFHGSSVIINGMLHMNQDPNTGLDTSYAFGVFDNPTMIKATDSSFFSKNPSTSIEKYYMGDGIIPLISSETMFEQSNEKIRATVFDEFEHHKPFTKTTKEVIILSILQMISNGQGKFRYTQNRFI